MPYLVTFFLAYVSGIPSDILSGILSGISSEILCGWGPAGNTLILSLRWRSGGERSDPELVVEVRRGTLWSRGCCWGPAGNTASRARSWGPARITLIQRLLLGSGGEHGDLELAVEVRQKKEEEAGGRRRKEEEGGRRRKEEEGGGRRRKEEEGGGQADIKSNNPHLTGGEK